MGHGEGDAHDAGQRGGGAEHAETHAHARINHEVAHRANVGGQQTRVQGVAAGQHQGGGAEVAVELAGGNQGAGEGDAADVGGGLDHAGGGVRGEAGVVVNVGGDTGQHGGHAHQRVEGGHQLRQVRDLNLLRDGCVHEDHPYSVIQSFPSFDT